MFTLSPSYLHYLQLPIAAAQQLAELRYLQGRYHCYQNLSPDLLAAMSAKSSYGITGNNHLSTASDKAFDYPQALRFVAELDGREPLNSHTIQQLHGRLHPQGGHWRSVKLTLSRRGLSSDTLQIPGSKMTINTNIENLLQSFYAHTTIDPLFTVPLFGLELMKIFPFLDGNRRMMLLLMRYLLLANDHQVVRYIDLESELLATERAFYRSLYQCSRDDANPIPWLSYWWVLIRRLYQRFDRQLNHANINAGRGSKTALIQRFVIQQQKPFRSADVCAAFPTISRDQIRMALRGMRDNNLIAAQGKGRAAVWIKPLATAATIS
ncbi:MAG: Fic family protein [Oceanicoccus sp.]